MLPQHLDQLEAVELRHADVDQDDGDVVLQQNLERFARRRRANEVLIQLGQDDLVAQQLGWLVVDQKDVDAILGVHRVCFS